MSSISLTEYSKQRMCELTSYFQIVETSINGRTESLVISIQQVEHYYNYTLSLILIELFKTNSKSVKRNNKMH